VHSQLVVDEPTRPRAAVPLPLAQLVLMSAYWFGINAVWGGYEWFGQAQLELLAGVASRGTVSGTLELLGALVAIAVVPTVGAISDHAQSRFGRRKGFIISGATLDLLFLGGLALLARPEPSGWQGEALGSPGLLVAYGVLFLSLQLSSNLAQGPYQGFVPDLVVEPQVALASGLVGVMRTLGNIGGALIVLGLGNAAGLWGLAIVLIGLVQLLLAVLTFALVPNGPPGLPRGGRPWRAIALEAWGLDALRERSFVRMTVVRLLFLMGTGIFVNVSRWYLDDSLGLAPAEQSAWGIAGLGAAAIATVLVALPASRLSDRIGRRPVIRLACLAAAGGLAIIALAPSPPIAVIGLALMGAGAGAYLAVDWALMTETVPLSASGRYMGLANIANSISGPLGVLIAGTLLIDAFTRAGLVELGPRAAVAAGIPAIALAAVALRGVRPSRGPDAAPSAAAVSDGG
jgi:Na+/melibiose symporter-like transporter